MNFEDIERLGVQGFTIARRGYDQREVDKFLVALTEWLETDAARDLGGVAVKRKLELAGKSTAQILLTTEQESEQMRQRTDEECAELRAGAEAASRETRQSADDYAKKVRERADQYARQTGETASETARDVEEESAARSDRGVISDWTAAARTPRRLTDCSGSWAPRSTTRAPRAPHGATAGKQRRAPPLPTRDGARARARGQELSRPLSGGITASRRTAVSE